MTHLKNDKSFLDMSIDKKFIFDLSFLDEAIK